MIHGAMWRDSERLCKENVSLKHRDFAMGIATRPHGEIVGYRERAAVEF
jgi:hypothetical protein